MYKVVADANGGKQVAMTEEEIAARQAEEAAGLAERAATAYIEARKVAYGDVGAQLDEMYWDLVNGTTVWKDRITAVKADNPKPVQ